MNRMMLVEKLTKRIEDLPDQQLVKLLKLLEELAADDLKCMQYFGCWKDREDLDDALGWVRRLRDEERHP